MRSFFFNKKNKNQFLILWKRKYVVNDAQVATQFAHETDDFLSRTEHFDTSSVRIVTDAKRAFDRSREFPAFMHTNIGNFWNQKN